MLNEVKSAFGGKKLIGIALGFVLLLVMASPVMACRGRGCWSWSDTGPGYAFARVFCYNPDPEEPIPPAEAIAPPSDGMGRATARATSVVIINNGAANVTSSATAIANTGGNNQE